MSNPAMKDAKSTAEVDAHLTYLNSGLLTVTGRLIDASNATLYAICSVDTDGQVRDIRCIYKPIAGERPLWDFPDGSLANREYLTFLVSNWLELHLVPPTILRDGPYGTGMVQLWIDIDNEIDLAQFYRSDDLRLRSLALLDLIINNTDRKIGHLLPTRDGHLYGCDHGVTFHADDKLRTVLWQWEGVVFTADERALLERALDIFTHEKLDIISGLITSDEITAVIKRIERNLESDAFPSPNPDWPAIPWPPF